MEKGKKEIKTRIYVPSKKNIAHVARLLREGEVAAIPTETVYGLAADAWNDAAVRRIFEIKGRPQDNPLIVHISHISQMTQFVMSVSPLAKALAKRFWPGPLTIVQRKSDRFCTCVTAGLDTVAIRMPSHPVARAIISASGTALAAPSANLSGKPSPTTVQHVYEDLNGKVRAIVDGGKCEVGVESTVVAVDADSITVLRPGGITVEQLKEVCPNVKIAKGVLEHLDERERVLSPGMKYKHYAPKTPVVILDGDLTQFSEYVEKQSRLGRVGAMVFDGETGSLAVPCVSYGVKEDGLSEAAGLFRALRAADELGVSRVYARMPAKDGVGFAVYNRLLRAAAFHVVDLDAPHKPFVVGLTGQTGAGKSTVSAYFAKAHYVVIDCDRLARTAVEKGAPALAAIAEEFGSQVLHSDGSLNRAALGRLVFSDKQALKRLNEIELPYIVELIQAKLSLAAEEGARFVLLDAPTLFESGADRLCDTVVCVTAEESVRLARIKARDGITDEDAKNRLNAQQPEEFYLQKSAYRIVNNGSEEALRQEFDKIMQSLDALRREKDA